jgi:RsiW-degrading membrane proteinase PrsW (M82 family)
MIGLWILLSFTLGLLFVYLWTMDFRRSYKSYPVKREFLRSYKFKETIYFILIISLPVLFVNYSGLDGFFFHNNTVLFISSILLSFSISLIWFLYLLKVDHFEKEPFKTVLLVFALGAVFTFFVFPLSTFVNEYFHFQLNGDLWNDWWYCVFGIGMIEEFVKLIPFLIILKFSKQVNEPFDYIFYASISALGFAFVENTIYLNDSFLTAVYGRALFASVAHMFFSSTIAYGLVYLNYIKVDLKGFQYPILLFLAALGHGFYDFWMINDVASEFYFLTTFFFLLSIYLWATMINNSLNISPFYNLRVSFRKDRLKYRIVNLLISSFYFAYLMTFLLNNKLFANKLLFYSWHINVFILLFLAFNLSQIELIRGFVKRLSFGSRFLFFLPRIYSTENYAGRKVKLSIPELMVMRPGKEFLRDLFPIEGFLLRRLSIKGDVNHYFIRSEKGLAIKGVIQHHFVIKLISTEENIFSRSNNPMVLYGLKSFPDFKFGVIPDKEIVFLHETLGVEIK